MPTLISRRAMVTMAFGGFTSLAALGRRPIQDLSDDSAFPTRVHATQSVISGDVRRMKTRGLSRANDGGKANYVRVSSEPSHAGKFRSADRFLADGTVNQRQGGWWELDESRPGPQHFGALAVGNATAGWQDAINYAATTGRPIYPIDGLYLLSSPPGADHAILTIPTGADITIVGSGRGCRLKVPDRCSDRGDYRMIVSADRAPMGKVDISGLLFDGNGSNNLVKDSRANIRSGYAILLYSGDDANLHDLWFENIAGRSAVVLASNGKKPGWRSVRMYNNCVANVGGAISGNEAQNDHSSFYVEAEIGQVSNNIFLNTNKTFDPQSPPQCSCTAMEIHCVNAVMENNTVTNYGTAGMAVAVNFEVESQTWRNNKFLGCKSNAFKPYTKTKMGALTVSGNTIQVDNLNSAGGCGIFQDPSPSETSATIKRLEITDNVISSMRTTPARYSTHGVLLCAFDSLLFLRNRISFWQCDGLRIQDQQGQLAVSNAKIDQCEFHNCGMQIGAGNPFAIYILNGNARKLFSNITIGAENHIWQTQQAPGSLPMNGRGVKISGPGLFQNITIQRLKMDNIAPRDRMNLIQVRRENIKVM